MIRNIAVDSGKYATKIAAARNGMIVHGRFLTKMDPNVDKQDSSDTETYAVEYEGQKYLLGKGARTQSFNDTKMEDIHKIATYTALTTECAGIGSGDHVNLAIGCPLADYVNKDRRSQYRDFMVPQNKQIDITVNGKRKMFYIDKFYVYPESSGVIYLNKDKYKDSPVGVIDIGGLNANCCIYENCLPISGTDTMFTLDLGGNVLSQTATTLVERLGTGKLKDYTIADMMAKNGLKKGADEKSAQIIKQCKADHVKKIKDACIANGWNIEYTEIVFTGGAAGWLKDDIVKVFPYYDIDNLDENADFKNVDGYLLQMLERMNVTL